MGKARSLAIISFALLLLLGCARTPATPPITERPDAAAIAAFSQNIEARQATMGHITYNAVINGVESKVDFYFDGEEYARVDYELDDRLTRTYFVRDQSVVCFAGSYGWLCSAMQIEPPFALAALKSAVRQGMVYSAGNKTILKLVTSCYEVRSQSSNDTRLYCTSQNGYPLYVQNNISGKITTLTAVKYRADVDDSVFAVPAVVHYPKTPRR